MSVIPPLLSSTVPLFSDEGGMHFLYKNTLKSFGLVGICLVISGCKFNLYSNLDKPSGDAQLLAAARACFDQGDFECAGKYYSQVSSSSSDQANSETAFSILAQDGATVGTFMKAVIKYPSDAGKMITYISNALTNTAGETPRMNIFHAYQKYKSISNEGAQGLVVFITSITLLAELLAESSLAPGNLEQTDLVSNPTQCLNSPPTGCDAPTGSALQLSGIALDLATATDTEMSGAPTLHMINAAVAEIAQGVELMAAQGNLASSTVNFATELNEAAAIALAVPSSQGQAYRYLLLNLNIGTE